MKYTVKSLAGMGPDNFDGDPDVPGQIVGWVTNVYRQGLTLTVTEERDGKGARIKVRVDKLPAFECPYKVQFSGLKFETVDEWKPEKGRNAGRSIFTNVFTVEAVDILDNPGGPAGPGGPSGSDKPGWVRDSVVTQVKDRFELENVERTSALANAGRVTAGVAAKLYELAAQSLKKTDTAAGALFGYDAARAEVVKLFETVADAALGWVRKNRPKAEDLIRRPADTEPEKSGSEPETKPAKPEKPAPPVLGGDFPAPDDEQLAFLAFLKKTVPSPTKVKMARICQTAGVMVWGAPYVQFETDAKASGTDENETWRRLDSASLAALQTQIVEMAGDYAKSAASKA
jgi:hypothetical protein